MGLATARSSIGVRRAALVAVLAMFSMGMSDCKGTEENLSINEINIWNFLAGSPTPPSIAYGAPPGVAVGDRLQGSVCVRDRSDAPVIGVPWYVSLFGDDPSAGSHVNGTLDSEGCMSWELVVNGLPAKLWTSDGEDTWEVEDFLG